MADRKNYHGPFSVVIRIDGQDHERVIGSGLDWAGAHDVADLWGSRPHVGQVSIRDEPTQHTVEIVHDRDRADDDESGEGTETRLAAESQHTGRGTPRGTEQSEGDSTPVG